MIKFDWRVIKLITKNDPKKVIQYFKYRLEGKKFAKLVQNYYKHKLVESSFLLEPEAFIANKKNGALFEQYIYLDLAAKRNYIDYYLYKNKDLNIIFNPYNVDSLSLNRLLIIEEDVIKFVYE